MSGSILYPTETFATQIAAASYSSGSSLPDDARSIQVVKFTKVGNNSYSSTYKDAYYSSTTNFIYVKEPGRDNQSYSVSKNPAYGQDGDYRANYEYTAGNYYFNL